MSVLTVQINLDSDDYINTTKIILYFVKIIIKYSNMQHKIMHGGRHEGHILMNSRR
jgi:hypothetical protein